MGKKEGKKSMNKSEKKSAPKNAGVKKAVVGAKKAVKKSSKKVPLLGSLLKKSTKEAASAVDTNLMPIADMPVMVRNSPQHTYDAYVMNLSGTLFKGDLLMPGVDKLFESLQLMRRPMYFMSSNTHSTPSEYQETLATYGMDVDLAHIFTPVRVAIEYVKREFPGAHVYAICDSKFRSGLMQGDIKLTDDPDQTDVVLVAHDRDFSFDKLNKAFRAITGSKRAKLVTTSMVRSWPTAGGEIEPGTRAIVRAIESAAQTRAIRNLGTPESAFLDCMFEHLDLSPRRVLLVSDSLSGDIRMAKHFGMPTALVLTGEASLSQAQEAPAKDQPNFVLDSVAQIVPEYILNQL